MTDLDFNNVVIEHDGDTLRIKAQEGSIHDAGSGERQLWSMLVAMGPMSATQAKEWMEGFIPSDPN